jgi:hypothetical protein
MLCGHLRKTVDVFRTEGPKDFVDGAHAQPSPMTELMIR